MPVAQVIDDVLSRPLTTTARVKLRVTAFPPRAERQQDLAQSTFPWGRAQREWPQQAEETPHPRAIPRAVCIDATLHLSYTISGSPPMLQVLVSTPLPLFLLSLPGKGVQPLRRGFLVARTSLAVKASPHPTSHVFSLPFNPFFFFFLTSTHSFFFFLLSL